MTTNYIINKTDGTFLVSVPEGTVISQSGLHLIGKNYVGFGQALNDDLVALAENFASNVGPVAPLTGQLWFDKSQNKIKVYTGTAFKGLTVGHFQNTRPNTAAENEFWYDTSTSKLYVYSGGQFNLVGPNIANTKSGLISDTIADTAGIGHDVLRLVLNSNNLAIITKDEFLPAATQQGFLASTVLAPGINVGNAVNVNSNHPEIPFKLVGTSTLADALNDGGSGLTAQYILRSDQSGTVNGSLTAYNGFYVGATGKLSLAPDTVTNDLLITHSGKNGSVFINAADATATLGQPIVTVRGANRAVGIGTTAPATTLHVLGDTTLQGNVNVGAPSSSGFFWNGQNVDTADNSNRVATTAYVKAQLIDTVLAGAPTATTAQSTDNSARIATTAWVASQGFKTVSGISGLTASTSGTVVGAVSGVKTLNFVGPNIVATATTADSVDVSVIPPALVAGVPSGLISMWYGLATSCPVGWAVCNGTHGTPDLRDRFIVGAGTTYNQGTTGGAASSQTNNAGAHNHGGFTGDTVLTVEQLPAHSHNFSTTLGTRKVSAGGSAPNAITSSNYDTALTNPIASTGGGLAHNHTIATDGTHNHAVNTLPPYYALCYIMKL